MATGRIQEAIAKRARNVDGDGIFRTKLAEPGSRGAWLYPELPWGGA
jgi:hypothetical protein